MIELYLFNIVYQIQYATNYLRNGGQLEQLRIVMGHRDISTTQRYLSLMPEDLYKAQLSASPYDRARRNL